MDKSVLIINITFGPYRQKLERDQALSLFLGVEMSGSLPHGLLEIASEVRRKNEDLPQRVIRRRVRDAIDRARWRRGCFDNNGAFETGEALQKTELEYTRDAMVPYEIDPLP